MTEGQAGPSLTIVIPVGPGDESWRDLVADLAPQLGPEEELVLSAAGPRPTAGVPAGAAWLHGPRGRARQLNAGAAAARGHWLWFLHADSQLPPEALPALRNRLPAGARAVWFFDLRFRDDGPPLMALTAAGARFRSRVLGLPFGDQGLALARDAFEALGGFPESARHGEDHLLVWAARRAGLAVRPVGASIGTSARKYRRDGWLRTTATHLWLTVCQATPEGIRWLIGR